MCGGQPADRADARPGRCAGRGRRACGLPQLHPEPGRDPARRARDDERPAGAGLRRARTRDHAALPGPARFAAGARPARPVCHRRGALRQPVGPRLPRGLPLAQRAARALSRGAAHRADGHRRRPHPRRHRRAAAAAEGPGLHQQLRPAQHPLRHRRERQRPRPAAALHQRRTRRRGRHRLLPVAQEGRRDRRLAGGRRHPRPALPRRPRQRGAPPPPGPLPAGRGPGDGGHRGLRHGHRQARCALCGPPRPAQEHRRLLPGDRPCRPRRPARRRLDGLRSGRRGQPAPHDRREPGR